MATQQQRQPLNKLPERSGRRTAVFQRMLFIIIVSFLALVVAIIWVLGSLKIISNSWASIASIIIAVLGAVFTIFQAMHLFISGDKHLSSENSNQAGVNTYIPPAALLGLTPIIVASSSTQPLSAQLATLDKSTPRGIVGLPPPTDSRTIQQRGDVVKVVYTKLTQTNITAIALTGIGGIGKSTLAALIYRYTEEQRQNHARPFLDETVWLAIDPAVTFADLAGNLFEALGKHLPDMSNLGPQNQAVALFNALNTVDKPRLIILDQFENLLDWNTGHALTDRPGVGEWLDILNSQQCASRLLLTSRPRPVGTREYPPTYLQEYPVGGLTVREGVELLHSQGVQEIETELQTAVLHCAGHAYSLTLLASLIRSHRISLATLIKNAAIWRDDIANYLLDQIYTKQLNEVQRGLLLAFSVYREPVTLDAPLAVIDKSLKAQTPLALKALLIEHLLEAVGEGRYQLHAIIADYVQNHFDESSEHANEEALRIAHTKAAQYYLARAAVICPPREHRNRISDVKPLVEAIWQLCQAMQWLEAYALMQKEGIFADIRRWGGNAILLEFYQLLLRKWHPEPLQAVNIYNDLGTIYSDLARWVQAQEYLEQALVLSRNLGDREEECRALNQLGWTYSYSGRMIQAQAYFEQALALCKRAGNYEQEVIALYNLGRVYYFLGQFEQAGEYYQQILQLSKERNDHSGEGIAFNGLGLVCMMLGRIEASSEHYEHALMIRKQTGERLKEGRTLKNLGFVYTMLGQTEKALPYLQEALDISQEVGDRVGEGMVLNGLGLLYMRLGQFELARRYLEHSLDFSKEVNNHWEEGLRSSDLGKMYILLGQNDKAIEYFKHATQILTDTGDRWVKAKVLYEFGKLFLEENRYDIALACLLLAKEVFDKIQSSDHVTIQADIDALHEEIGEERFSSLLAAVEPQAQQIVDQALQEGKP